MMSAFAYSTFPRQDEDEWWMEEPKEVLEGEEEAPQLP
jgi:hypothetical protein